MRSPVRTLAITCALVVALLSGAVACSGSSDDGASGAPADAATTSTTIDPADPASVPADPSEGCGLEPDVALPEPDQRPGDVEATFDADGVDRIYRLSVPADYVADVAVPLVLNLHGSGSNALQASIYGDVPRAAAARGMITVAAQAINGQWQLAGVGADAEFLDALVDDIEARFCVDRNREHLIGMSLGAWKAAITACRSDGRYASVALVTVEVFPGSCAPLPVVAFHGTADATVPYETGDPLAASSPNAGLPGAETNIAAWAESGGCDPEPELSPVGDDVQHRVYAGCDLGVGVELYTVEGGGHTWPGADIDLGPPTLTTQTIDATDISLDWFEAHPRRG